jgi:hydrogenase maturation protease
MADGRQLILGIGNPERGDDAIGYEVVRLLRGRLPAEFEALHRPGEATAIVQELEGADVAFLVDATVSGARPGTVRRFDVTGQALPSRLAEVSSHGFGLAQAIELARALGSLPRHCIVYAIEGELFEPGAALSPEAARATARVVQQILDELTDTENDRCMKPR